MKFDELLTQLRKNAADIDKTVKKLGFDLSTYFSQDIVKLNNCLDTYSAFKVLISTVVKDASGDLNLAAWTDITSNFDKNWDAFAKEYNEIFNGLNNTDQKNVLEVFARTHFGDNVFEAGSVIKNEIPGILSGISGFKQGVSSFKGSYRNPVEAANKIRNGVNSIVKSTEQIAGAANNVVKLFQKLKNTNPQGSAILDKLSNLSAYNPVNFALKTINAAAGTINMGSNLNSGFANVLNVLNSVKQNDIKEATESAKTAYENLEKVKSEVDAITEKKPIPGEPTTEKMPVNKTDDEKSKPRSQNNKQGNEIKSASTNSYVCSKAKIKCTNGDKISTLTVFPDRTIWLTGEPQANISDHISMQNIAPFGKCHTVAYPPTGSATSANHGKLTPMPCVPNTPFCWMQGNNDVLLKGHPALLKSSTLKCIYGGTISITFDGQVEEGVIDLSFDEFESPEELIEKQRLTPDQILDGIQLALDVAGFIPGVGAFADLTNAAISACRGDWVGAGMSLVAAVPGIGDAAAGAKMAHKGAKMARAAKTI